MLLRLLLLHLLIFSNLIQAQTRFELSIRVGDAYLAFNNLNFTELHSICSDISLKEPGNRFADFLKALGTGAELLIDEDETKYRQALGSRSMLIEKLENTQNASPYQYYCLSELYLHWALIRIKYNDEFHAALDLKSAIRYVRAGMKTYPEFIPLSKSLAVCEAMAAAVPEKYQWLANLVGIQGQNITALSRMEEFLNHPQARSEFAHLMPEAICFYLAMKVNIEGENTLFSNELLDRDEALVSFANAWLAAKKRSPEKVIYYIDKLKSSKHGIQFCYVDYLKGEAQLNLLKDPRQSLLRFLKCSSGKSFKSSAIRKIAWYYLINGNVKQYEQWMELTRFSKNQTNDEDIQAQLEYANKNIPAPELVKARLLFDGGNYNAALRVLHDFIPAQPENKLEKLYRTARCLEEKIQMSKAIHLYKNVIRQGSQSSEFYAASSAYRLALYYAGKNEQDSARHYCRVVYQVPNQSYKKSLSMKARALERSLK